MAIYRKLWHDFGPTWHTKPYCNKSKRKKPDGPYCMELRPKDLVYKEVWEDGKLVGYVCKACQERKDRRYPKPCEREE